MSLPYSSYPTEMRHDGRLYTRTYEAAHLTGYQPFTLQTLARQGKIAGVQRNRVWYVHLPSVQHYNRTRRFALKERAVAWLVEHKSMHFATCADACRAMARDGIHLSVVRVQRLMRGLGMTPRSRSSRVYDFLKAHPELRAHPLDDVRRQAERALRFPVSIPLISYGWRRLATEQGNWPDFDPAQWMTVEEVCEALGITNSTARRRAQRQGWLVRRGPGRRVYYYRAQIEAEAQS